MGIGVVMASDCLIPVAEDRPATLQVQGHLGTVKTHRSQIVLGLLHHKISRTQEIGMTMQLPHTIEVTGPGTTGAWVTRGCPPQRQQGLQLCCQLQRIQCQLGRGDNGREERIELEGHRSIKKADP